MSRIERDVERLMRTPEGLTMLDGLLIGALVGAAAASLVVVGQLIATRRLARHFKPAPSRSLPGPPPEGSPL